MHACHPTILRITPGPHHNIGASLKLAFHPAAVPTTHATKYTNSGASRNCVDDRNGREL